MCLFLLLNEDMMQVIDEEEMDDFPEILRKAAERLADVFAVELREVESSRRVPHDLGEDSSVATTVSSAPSEA